MTGAPPPHIRVSGAAPNAELYPSDVAQIERCVTSKIAALTDDKSTTHAKTPRKEILQNLADRDLELRTQLEVEFGRDVVELLLETCGNTVEPVVVEHAQWSEDIGCAGRAPRAAAREHVAVRINGGLDATAGAEGNGLRIGPAAQVIQAELVVGDGLALLLRLDDPVERLAVALDIGGVWRECDVAVENTAHRGLKQNRAVKILGDGERSRPRVHVVRTDRR